MKILSLMVNTDNIELSDEIKKLSIQEIMSRIIVTIINTYANQSRMKGLTFDEQRRFYHMGDKFEQAIEQKAESVELEDAWFELIKKAMKEANLPPDRLLNRVYDLVENADMIK